MFSLVTLFLIGKNKNIYRYFIGGVDFLVGELIKVIFIFMFCDVGTGVDFSFRSYFVGYIIIYCI